MLLVYSLFDSAVGEFGAPVYYASESLARRSFSLLVYEDTPHYASYRNFPSDFSVFYLGTYCPESGSFDLLPSPKAVFRLDELLSDRRE